MPVPSVYSSLEPLLPLVSKPIQYVGGELNSVAKEWDATDVRWALMYPDAYEVGLPNQGIQILYEILNADARTLAERTYSVWPDLEELMRSRGVPQFTVESHRPVRAFDVLGVSFSTELGYTNLLTALDAAGGQPGDLASLTVYAVDLVDYRASGREIGAVWRRLAGRNYPAMAAIGVARLWDDAALVELQGHAVIG